MIKQFEDLFSGLRWIGGISLAILVLIIATQPASYTDGLTLSAVFVSLFFVVAGIVSWVGVYLRRRNELKTGYPYVLRTSLRQGLLSGATVVALLLLQLLRVISIIDIVFIVLLAIVTELYLSSRKVAA